MWKILRFRYRKVLDRIIKKEKEKGGQPATPPAWAGSQAGPFGRPPGLTTGLVRATGRSARVGRRPHIRPGPAPWPAHPGAPHPPVTPASLPAWAGSQAGPLGWCPGLPTGLGRVPGRPARFAPSSPFWLHENDPTALFSGPLFKGFLPQINSNLLPTS